MESGLTCERRTSASSTASIRAEGIEENALSNKLCINPFPELLQYGNPFFNYPGLKEVTAKCSSLREK